MRLLLTSMGIATDEIAAKLRELVGDGNHKVGFIPTAANAESGNKDWFFRQITDLRKFGFDWIDVIDPSAADVDWKTRLAEVSIVFVSGGNTFHLLNQARLTGFGTWLKEHIEDIVYVGSSAGSILVTPNIGIASVDEGDENLPGLTDLTGLSLTDFEISPHTPEMVSYAGNEHYAGSISNKLYACTDQSAVVVHDGGLEFIGEHREYN